MSQRSSIGIGTVARLDERDDVVRDERKVHLRLTRLGFPFGIVDRRIVTRPADPIVYGSIIAEADDDKFLNRSPVHWPQGDSDGELKVYGCVSDIEHRIESLLIARLGVRRRQPDEHVVGPTEFLGGDPQLLGSHESERPFGLRVRYEGRECRKAQA